MRPGNYVTLPNQPVDTRGFLYVPYAGLVPAAGKRASEVSQEIVNRIKNRAIEPQVEVAVVTENSSLITVVGEVNAATAFSPTGRIPAQLSGERLLDVITRAGGLKDQGQDTWVVLERHGRRAAVPFGSLIYEPGNNIWAWPDDTIFSLQGAADVPGLWSIRRAGPVPVQRGPYVVCLADDACRSGCGRRRPGRFPGRSWFGVPLST